MPTTWSYEWQVIGTNFIAQKITRVNVILQNLASYNFFQTALNVRRPLLITLKLVMVVITMSAELMDFDLQNNSYPNRLELDEAGLH
jgi:hypothetical protein